MSLTLKAQGSTYYETVKHQLKGATSECKGSGRETVSTAGWTRDSSKRAYQSGFAGFNFVSAELSTDAKEHRTQCSVRDIRVALGG